MHNWVLSQLILKIWQILQNKNNKKIVKFTLEKQNFFLCGEKMTCYLSEKHWAAQPKNLDKPKNHDNPSNRL
jgi:hypothetical protein